MMPGSASIILASRNEGSQLTSTLDSMLSAACRMRFEIIVVDDGSAPPVSLDFQAPVRAIRTPGLGIAPARNAGARLASGDMLVFCDAHIRVPDGWLDSLAQALEAEACDAVTPGIGPLEPEAFIPLYKLARSAPLDVVGCGRVFRTLIDNTWLPRHEHPIECPILSGGCFAVRREAWPRVGGYEDSFRGYGYDEEEISLKLWLFGHRLMTAPRVRILHKFRPAAPYRIASEDMLHNRLVAAMCHFSEPRLRRLLDCMRMDPALEPILRAALADDSLKAKRNAYFAARAHDDDWYFQKFSLDL